MNKFQLLLLTLHRDDDAYEVARELSEENPKDAELHNALAWTILDDENVQHRDLDLAMKLAVRANELTKSENAAILDTLARAHFEKGDVDKAIEWEKLAVEHSTTDDMKAEMQKALDKYTAAKSKPAKKKGQAF